MKVFVIGTIARQVEGEYVFVRLEKGYAQASKADNHVRNLARTFNESIQVPGGPPIPCLCERGVFEVDVDIELSSSEGA